MASTLSCPARASTDIVQFEPGTPVGGGDVTDTSLSGSATIYALSVFFGTGGRNPTISSTGGATLTITSGAISQNVQNGGVTFGDPTGVNYLNLNFPVEAVIYDGAYNGQGNINFYNLVTAPSLTKIGPGNLSLDNAAANVGSPNADYRSGDDRQWHDHHGSEWCGRILSRFRRRQQCRGAQWRRMASQRQWRERQYRAQH